MKIYELLLPHNLKDKSLTSKAYKDIDTLQTRMNLYVDKITSMASSKAQDFLKTKLQADYTALKDIIKQHSLVSEGELGSYGGEKLPKMKSDPMDVATSIDDEPEGSYNMDTDGMDAKKYVEKYMHLLPKKYQMVLKMRYISGMYTDEIADAFGITRSKLATIENNAMDQLRQAMLSDKDAAVHKPIDRERRYFYEAGVDWKGTVDGIYQASETGKVIVASPGSISKKNIISEAVYKLPLTPGDFNLVKQLMKHPIPAIVAPMYVMEIIDDDELNDQFRSLENTYPDRDVRPLIVEWIRRVMPDQMYHFGQEVADENQKRGTLSPLHGDDPHQNKGSSFTGTGSSGDAYGSF